MSDLERAPGTPPFGEPDADRVRREALGWLRRLTSGDATPADIAALDRWRAEDPAHRKALARASLLWDMLEPVARQAQAHQRTASGAGRPYSAGRRALLGGAMAAAVGGVAYAVVRPPLHLWPALAELTADYRTATGERRKLTVATGLTVEMNTRTSIATRAADETVYAVELIAGQLAVTLDRGSRQRIAVTAADGRAVAETAMFDIRRDGASVCVTCTEGLVQVTHGAAITTLRRGDQLTYGGSAEAAVAPVDPTVITSWQRGQLIFRDVPLGEVIDEVNRYRAGRIIVLDEALARRKVIAGFRLDQIDDVVTYVGRAFGARVRSLPGGLVLLS